MLKNLRKHFWVDSRSLVVILVGSLLWSLTMVKSGLKYGYGLGFWGPNGHDGVWHIALARSLAKGQLEMPNFAGEIIKNYHLGFDFFLAILHKFTGISVSTLYFQIIPPLLALGLGFLVYKFVTKWKNPESALWALFFVYFGGNFGWIITLFRNEGFGGESAFWSQQAMSTLINPPFALSLVVLMFGLNLFLKLKSRSNWGLHILLAAIFGLLLSIKVYAGVLFLTALLIIAIVEIFYKKSLSLIKIFVLSLVISLILFLPFNARASGLVEIKPFWFLETMMSFPDRVGWSRFGEAMVNYKNGGDNPKAFAAYLAAFVIFFIGNFGTRIIANLYFVKTLTFKQLGRIDFLLALMIVGGVFGSMFFVQKGTAWNTIQFLYYSLFFGGIFAGIGVSELLNSKFLRNKKLIGSAIVLLTLPTLFATLRHYIPERPPAMLPIYELEALKFLEKQPRGTVLVMPFDRQAAQNELNYPPRPLFLYESTAYVSAFSGQPVWLEDEVNLDIMSYNWRVRREKLESILDQSEADMINFLKAENISYVYVVNKQVQNLGVFSGMRKIFENSEVSLYSATIE